MVDPAATGRESLAARLRRQGFDVTIACDGAEGARLALTEPPAAVVADLWMPSISGVQLCRLLRAEPATADVPVVLRGPEGRRNRFWAERAGAVAYVVKGRMGDLVRALGRSIRTRDEGGFFTVFADDGSDVRDRIAAHLDAALFDSVIAAEVRNLARCESFERLFDLFAQFVSEVATYRWLALETTSPARFGLHASPGGREDAEREARERLGLATDVPAIAVEDDDATTRADGPPALMRTISFGDAAIGRLAIAPDRTEGKELEGLLDVFARELGGAVRMASLVEESRRLATVDALTGLFNRRAFIETATREVARADRYVAPLSLLLFDLDHFKLINDKRGHASGDRVLHAVGHLLTASARDADLCARWGGEEFVVAYLSTGAEGALVAAERLRAAVEAMEVVDERGGRIPVTVSIGLAAARADDTLASLVGRADRAMYRSKAGGRNRVTLGDEPAEAAAAETARPQVRATGGIDATG